MFAPLFSRRDCLELSIWFFFIPSDSLLRLSILPLVSRIFTLTYWSIFKIAALKSVRQFQHLLYHLLIFCSSVVDIFLLLYTLDNYFIVFRVFWILYHEREKEREYQADLALITEPSVGLYLLMILMIMTEWKPSTRLSATQSLSLSNSTKIKFLLFSTSLLQCTNPESKRIKC